MAQHGYLREFDEDWDRSDDRNREQGSSIEQDRDDRSRNFMFGDRDRGGRDHSFFDRMGDRARGRFSADDRQWRSTHRDDWSNREPTFGSRQRQQGFGGYQSEFDRSPHGFRSHQDDHYRSWRDQQIQALDQDYNDYCREREQQFHSDFDNWRRNRGQATQPQGNSPEEVMELNSPRAEATEFDSTSSPIADATLGTNNSENTAPGRR